MSTLTVHIPDDTMLALKVTPEQMANELRLAAAIKLYEVGRLSAGAAANLAGLPAPAFLLRLGEYGVSAFRMSVDELAEDVRRA